LLPRLLAKIPSITGDDPAAPVNGATETSVMNSRFGAMDLREAGMKRAFSSALGCCLGASLSIILMTGAFAQDAGGVDTPLRLRVGGGNIAAHLAGGPTDQLYEALNGVGAGNGRMDSYGWRDLARKPNPTTFDAALLEAYQHKIRPIILFEYQGSYQFLKPPQPIGSYADWFATGQAFARRFEPNGEWAREHGIRDWGVTVYTAINEPDVQATIPRKDYHDALAGLAAGVHSVNPRLRVVPGGFATCNSHGDATLRGYGPAIADLLENGALDGIDLHTYYNVRWYPLTRGREFSAQTCFDRVKAAMRLHRDINFYSTEYNISRDHGWDDPAIAARLFLTAFWDEMGVVRNDGHSSATVLAFPWNLANTGKKVEKNYAMAVTENPWSPDSRSKVLRLVLRLAGDMHFIALDPKGSGTFTLEGPQGRLYVWQDLPGWTDKPGTRWDLHVPQWGSFAELWGWGGMRKVVPVQDGKITIADLPGNETYMLLVRRSVAAPD
jgi:hypothetical protein